MGVNLNRLVVKKTKAGLGNEMKFIDSMFSCKFKGGKHKPVFSITKFWFRAFEYEKGILIILSKVERVNPFIFDDMSDVLANKFFKDLEVVVGEFFWIEHFPKIVGNKERRELFSKVEYKISGKKLERIGKRRVFLEQIEHLVGEELESIGVLNLQKKKKINLEGFD